MTAEKQKTPLVDWFVVLLCIVAAALSFWLSWQKLTGSIDSLVGCGKGSGCENVLGSKWSIVFGSIPVSIFSFLLYVAVIGSIFLRSAATRKFRIFAAFLMLCAAVWFTALQLVVMKTICPYCMAMHSLGVILALLILYSDRKSNSCSMRCLVAAILCVIALAIIQYLGPSPETHRVDSGIELPVGGLNLAENPHVSGEGRLVSFFNGKKSYRINALPHLGSVNAPKVIVKYFDYTCDSCKKIDVQLEDIQAKYPDQLTVILLPVPLNRSCNSHLPLGVKDHANACELARLALRVWLADSEQFASFHHWLFQYHQQPFEIAEAKAYSLVDAVKMDAVLDDEVEVILKQNVSDYKTLVRKTPVMPKLLLKDSFVLQGVTSDLATLEALLQEHLGLGEN